MVADLPAVMSSSSVVIADAILHDRNSLQRGSSARVVVCRKVGIAPDFSVHVPSLTALPSSAFERSARMLLPVPGVPAAPSRPLAARSGGSRCSDGLRGSGSSLSFLFPSVSEYFSCFRD